MAGHCAAYSLLGVHSYEPPPRQSMRSASSSRTVGPLEPGDAWFIARHSPARVLAEVDAKRGLLDRYAEVADM
ncbi:hypothetical protein KBZ21_39635, partial [Streptomyces sp. A73]|nr:hypothetical protein [Streptomyces sp. A73]